MISTTIISILRNR